ncbi:Ca2+/H+ antiporter [Saccharomonospora azurea SZMC 14600]|nr:Ca2+/H+ antiporter [Saccharomonospora azurea SZMC 14600]
MLVSSVRSVVTPVAIVRLVLGWGAVVGLMFAGPALAPPVAAPLLVGALALIIGVILVCAFGVVHEAEHLARRLGDPYGSLVLTLSIVLIEVILISAVMLGPGEHSTIARDSVMAVSMIILNAVVGLCLLVGGLRHGGMSHNRTGTSTYLALIVVLSTLAFAVPAFIGRDGSYTPGQAVPIIVAVPVLYAFFLFRQMGVQADDFREVDPRLSADTADPESPGNGSGRPNIVQVLVEHRAEVVSRIALLVVTVLPIVLLSHDMATLLDDGLGRLGAPVALAGVLIALIVFLPETITSVRAALQGEIQRVSNLCHGALVSTVGLTIPSVLAIGALTGQTVVLAESPANLLILAVTLLLSVATFAAPKVTAVHGAAHLVVFFVYSLALFA